MIGVHHIHISFVWPGSSRVVVWGVSLRRQYYFERLRDAHAFRAWYYARECAK